MRFWFQGGWRWKYKLSSLQKEKKKSSAREQLHHVRIVTCKKNARVERLTWAVQEDSVWEVTLCCGRRASFCFYQQDSSHLQPDFLFFFALAAPFCDNKGFTPSCCRSVMSRPVGLWRGGGASLGFLTQLLSFCGRAISFLLHGLQDSRSQRTRAVLLGNASERDRSELLLLNKPPPLSVLFSGKAFIFFSFLSHGFSVVWPEMRTKHTISKALLSH